MNWENADSDPVADLRAMAHHVAATSGYRPQVIYMSSVQYEQYVRWTKWREQTEQILATLGRRHFIVRMVLKRQLYGPLYKRYRPRWFVRSRELYRRRTGYYERLEREATYW